jgi:hypothetical protein
MGLDRQSHLTRRDPQRLVGVDETCGDQIRLVGELGETRIELARRHGVGRTRLALWSRKEGLGVETDSRKRADRLRRI